MRSKVGFAPRRLLLVCAALAGLSTGRAVPIISEFMAANNTTLADQDGDYADWIEIFNPDATTDSLGGYYLTNSATALTRWKIPAVSLPAGGYLIIFASEKNYTLTNGPLATNFNLAKSGGYVALVEPDGKTVASSYTYPLQYPDYSYGVTQPTSAGEAPQNAYFFRATPGAANGGQSNVLLTDRVVLSSVGGVFTGSTTVTLSGATGTEKIRYVLAPPSAAGDAVAVPTPTAMLYTGPLTISATQLLRAAVFSADDSQEGLPTTGMYIQMDNTTANRVDTFTSNLPLVIFDNNGAGMTPDNLIYYPGWIDAFEPSSKVITTLAEKPQFFTPTSWKVHGFSSGHWPKQSYENSLSDDLGNSRNEAFFGMDSDNKWDNISPWSIDRTYLHNAFVYSLGRTLGYWAPQETFSEMFIHSGGGPLDYTSYAGITNITDRIKVSTSRVNIYALTPGDVTAPNVTGGYILRIDHVNDPDTEDYTWTTTAGVTLMIDAPKLDEAVQPQINYITNYVREMENAMVADQASGYATHAYASYLDVPSWVDYHLLQTFVKNDDGLLFSEYFTKDVNGLIKAGPLWDFDRSMGSADGRDANPQQWNPYNDQDFWNVGWWSYLTHDPDFMQAWIDRWQSLRLTTLSTKSLTGLVNSLATQMGTAAPARDAARWPDTAPRFPGGWLGEIANWTSWLTARGNWIDQQFVSAPLVNVVDAGAVLIPPAGAEVVYTLDGTDPRASGGGQSAAAMVGSGPVALAAGQTFQARSFNASQATAYPGSPWSSPVTIGSTVSGLTGQFVNLSCQTQAGSGAAALVEGFVINGPPGTLKQFLLRGIGPGLTGFGVTGALAQPVLNVYDSYGQVISTDTGWSTMADAAAIQTATAATGAFALPSGSPDSAILISLPPGAYTLQVTGASAGTGTALAEVYQTVSDTAELANISSRAQVGGVAPNLTTGFVIGNGPAKVLVRASGPALTQFHLTSVLTQPQLQVFDSNSRLIASNAGWSTGGNVTQIAAAAAAVGAFAFPAGSADSALLLSLPAGAYTAVITSGDGTVGDALAECYLAP